MINVKDVGQALLDQGFKNAKGNGLSGASNDDFDALQRLIDPSTIPFDEREGYDPVSNPEPPAPPQPGALYFPKGRYPISQTLVSPEQSSHHLIGCGMPEREGTLENALQSTIVWSGTNGGTMVDYRGTGLIWDGLALWGKRVLTDTPADLGIKISKPSSGSPLDTGRIWFPSIFIAECGTGIHAAGDLNADSCAFGYAWIRDVTTAFHLEGPGATMFTFRFILPQGTPNAFKVNGGGRIYVDSINVVTGNPGTVLELEGSDMTNGFFEINGMTVDRQAKNLTILKNHDDGNGLQHVRFTNAHFTNAESDQVAKIDIDRTKTGGGSTGQTVVELVGCRGVTFNGGVLTDNAVIKGAASSSPSRLIVRDSELPAVADLVDTGASSNFSEHRRNNWVFNAGLQSDL